MRWNYRRSASKHAASDLRLRKQGGGAARMPEQHIFPFSDFAAVDVHQQAGQCLARVDGIDEQAFRSSQQADRLRGGFAGLLLARLPLREIQMHRAAVRHGIAADQGKGVAA